jgi:hypothetical protein
MLLQNTICIDHDDGSGLSPCPNREISLYYVGNAGEKYFGYVLQGKKKYYSFNELHK